MKLHKATLLATAAVVAALNFGVSSAMADELGEIRVTGEGRSSLNPDMARITMGVTNQAPTAAEAMATNNTQLGAVLERLKQSGIADRDMQTSGFNLGPRMEYGTDGQPPKLQGYEASNMLTVRVRDLSKLGVILDQVVSDGANTFQSLEFAHSAPQAALDEARVNAVQEAKRKAEQMAEAAGVKLGRIKSIEESGGMPEGRMMRLADAAMPASAVPVAAGELSYSLSVSITWEIGQP